MPFEIKKPLMPKKTFILNRNLHLDKASKVVEENDPTGVKVLGGKGKALYEEEAKLYGLDDSHRLVEEKPKETEKVIEPTPEKPPEMSAPIPEPVPAAQEVPAELKGKLPDDFPGKVALDAAEPPIHTYGQLAKFADDYTQIPGIGPAAAKKIAEVLAAK